MPKELEPGVLRITFPLPLGINHVHCYLLRGSDGAWILVDTSLALPHVEERWREVLAALDAPVTRIVITHFHPDHVGGAALVADLTGAEVIQGRLDYAQCERVWGTQRDTGGITAYLRSHGMTADAAAEVRRESDGVGHVVRWYRDPSLLDSGDHVDGWEAVHLPGHADGHIALFNDDVLIAGDTILGEITPNVGLWPESRPDPLADYLASLTIIAERAPRVAYPGHGRTIDDPPARAREIIAHHEERLQLVREAVADGPRSAYDVSLGLFPDGLNASLRRFAVVETLAHLEHLARRGELERHDGEPVRYGVR